MDMYGQHVDEFVFPSGDADDINNKHIKFMALVQLLILLDHPPP